MQKKVLKVELSIVDDLLNMKKKWDALYSDEIKTRTQVVEIVSKYKQLDKEAASMYEKSIQLLKNAAKTAKELGVNESQIKGLDALADAITKDVSNFARKEFRKL
jgi:LPS O-antigen subunit length determinant protein (WzzB/FepE family)